MVSADTGEATEVDQVSIAQIVIVRLLQSTVPTPTLYVSHLDHLCRHGELVIASVVLANVSQQKMDINGVEVKSPGAVVEAKIEVRVVVEVAGDRGTDRVCGDKKIIETVLVCSTLRALLLRIYDMSESSKRHVAIQRAKCVSVFARHACKM
jgi:hypothetical protein